MEQAPNPHGSNLRTAALVGAVVLAAVLPLAAASAGPVGLGDRGTRPEAPPAAPSFSLSAAPAHDGDEKARGSGHGKARGSGDGERTGDGSPVAARGTAELLSDLQLTGTSRCGPEVTSPEGLEAQTCVQSEGGDTWGRTYYRNTTGRALRAILSLMGPEGRTVQVHCELEAGGAPGTCETPRRAGRVPLATPAREAAHDAERELSQSAVYGAVAEIASADSDRLLLRSGSNSPETEAG
ncbi:hypothetical protein [Streptomyces sp. NPDC048639]|uniref:hypothetical protein n=1 Tax=Streptomyces sp. NPDC048639 TaxID=3365581 RepID=UPI00371554A9